MSERNPRVSVEFDTNNAEDGAIYVDGVKITKVRHFALVSSYNESTKFLVTRIVTDDNDEVVKMQDGEGNLYISEETIDVFKYTEKKDRFK